MTTHKVARLVTKNWGEFQHYKDRSPSWIKLHKNLLDNFDFQCLPVASRALAPMLWLLASEENDGSIEFNVEKIAFRLRMNALDVREAVEPLIEKGFFILAGDLEQSASNSLSQCLPREEREKEKEYTDTDVSVVGSKSLPTCPHQEIVDLYREILPELPQVRVWNGQRQKDLAARWKWVLEDLKRRGKPCGREDAVDFFRRMFEYVSKLDFLMGRSSDWSASLGWIVKAENFAKIIEGNYDNKEAA